MKLDALLANMKDFDYICDESVTWVNDNIIGQGYTVTTVLERMHTDTLIPEGERRVWIRNAKRMFDEPTAIVLGGDATVTDDYRVIVKGVLVKEGTQEECQSYIDNMSWVKFFKRTKQGFVKSTINDFTVAETDMGQTYKTRRSVKEVEITLERKITDSVEDLSFWEAVDY